VRRGMMRGKSRSIWLLLLLLAVGITIGGVIGDILSDKVAFLSYSYPIGLKQPVHLDLNVIDLTFGLMLDINIASIIGLVIAIILYRKL